MTFGPQNMRDIADKVQNLIHEAEKNAENTNQNPTDSKSLDHLLTSPAGADKLAKQIDKNKLVSKLRLSPKEGDDLWMAIENLGKDSPVINLENATAILQTFHKIAPKAEVNEALELHRNTLIEKYNPHFDDIVGYADVKKAIVDASKISPLAKDMALKLTLSLSNGTKGRNLDEGVEGIFNAIVYAIELAKRGDRSDLLHMLDDFETKYEGDNYAFDQKIWPELYKNIKELAKEILSHSK